MMMKVDRFVKRKDVELVTDSLENTSNRPIDALTQRQRRANELRVSVPVTRLGAKQEVHRLSKFDETDFEESTLSTIDGGAKEQIYPTTGGEGHHFASDLLRTGGIRQFKEQRYTGAKDGVAGYGDPEMEQDTDRELPDEELDDPLSKEIAEARSCYPDNAWYLQTQSPYPPVISDEVISIRTTSPAVARDQPPSRPLSAQKMTASPPPSHQPVGMGVPSRGMTKATTTFDKSTSYANSSAERSPIAPDEPGEPRRKKRPISDFLDYEIQTLKSMPFSELDHQAFDFDPRRVTESRSSNHNYHHDPTTARSAQTHLEKLQTLRSLSPAERGEFFSSQTKDQWAASTAFFERQLKGLVEELGKARDRRREVTARFEGEIRGRMAVVERSGEVIDQSLAEMRAKARGVLPGREENEASRVGT